MMPNRIFGGLAPIMDYNLTETNYANAYGIWTNLYGVVGDANSVIANMQDNEKLSPAIRNQVLGEAYFLRALATTILLLYGVTYRFIWMNFHLTK
jgi:hypothetical protein